MTFPQIISYKQAVQIPDSFGSWTHLRAVLDSNRQPVFAAGGPAVVFKMQDTNDSQKFYALKLFLKEQPNRERNFKAIDNYIRSLRDNPYLANYQYNPSEIWADDGEFPALLMDWIEGITMSEKVARLCASNDKDELKQLAAEFDRMGLWLLQQDMAHADIKPDNIIVTPSNKLKLVDYDGMYVPALDGTKSPELGTAEYRHPKRTNSDFNSTLDDFPILVLSLSLHVLSEQPSLYSKEKCGDTLLFTKEDYVNILGHRYLSFFQKNDIISSRFGLLMYILNQPIIKLAGLSDLLKVTAAKDRVLSTKAESEDGEWVDEYGAKYSVDRRKLIKLPEIKGSYAVLQGCEVICDEASPNDWEILPCQLTSIILPNSVTTIGSGAFSWCSCLTSITLPNSVTTIGYGAFEMCRSLISIIVNGNNFVFEDGVLFTKDKTQLHTYLYSNKRTSYSIPNSVTIIGDGAFEWCSSLTSITLPNSVATIGYGAFLHCNGLTSITLPNPVTAIGNYAFYSCYRLTSIYIPKGAEKLRELLINSGYSSEIKEK